MAVVRKTETMTVSEHSHDLSLTAVKGAGSPTLGINANLMSFGRLPAGKGTAMWTAFFRLDPTPVDRVTLPIAIKGVELKLYPLVSSGTTINIEVGLIKEDGYWDLAGGFSNYTTRNQIPFSHWNNGSATDNTVWVGDAPAFTMDPYTIQAIGTELVFYEGEAEGTIPVTGLISQISAYFAEEPNWRPMCFQITEDNDDFVARYQNIAAFSNTVGTPPTLTIHYEIVETARFADTVIKRPKWTTNIDTQ